MATQAEAADVTEILRKIRKIELRTRGLVNESFGGEYQSCFKGEGIDFEDFREYQPGDEVRAIDWNVTARMGIPFVKKFTEEREMTVFLAIDVSASGNYGSFGPSKRELMAEVAALLAFSALQNKDKVGLILFSDEVELYVPPKKGTSHALRLIREVLFCRPRRHGTHLEPPVHILQNSVRKRSLVFVISDFLFEEDIFANLKTVSRQHDMVAIQVSDPAEFELPVAGHVRLEDPETGQQVEVNTSNPGIRKAYAAETARWREEVDGHFKKLAIDKIDLRTDEEYLPALHAFFKRRGTAKRG
ncbi:DUF58 domain-containing protein [Verrucomicrobiales bacterium]|nr:DUF58 domain-containing protein [Verrucomicrobiales bacterium]MDC0275602.1 DUF58 domain-containing protein [Verrucomicrobiales bacterium]